MQLMVDSRDCDLIATALREFSDRLKVSAANNRFPHVKKSLLRDAKTASEIANTFEREANEILEGGGEG